MAVSSYASGTQTATLTTEHFLSSPNAAGVYELYVDANALVAGDLLILRAYKMVLTGGTYRLLYEQAFTLADLASEKIIRSMPVANHLTDTNALRFSLEQRYGAAGRAFPWDVTKHA